MPDAATDNGPGATGVCPRIRWLIAAQFVLAAAPLLGMRLQFGESVLVLIMALICMPFGALLTLSIWLGLGRTRLLWRVAIGLATSLYISIWPFLLSVAQSSERMLWEDRLISYLESVGPMSVLLFLFAGAFMLIGRRYQVALVGPDTPPPRSGRMQFSMLHILIVMSAIAIVLSLSKATRDAGAGDGHGESSWQWLIMDAFMFVIFVINTTCAVFSALGLTNVKRNIALVLIVSIVLGIAVAIAVRNDAGEWLLFFSCTLIAIVPTVYTLVSLLVVRSCGYRLVRRSEMLVG